MSEQIKLSVKEDIKKSELCDIIKNVYIKFCNFLENNEFLIKAEKDGNGWEIDYLKACIGHMNFKNTGVWLDVCEFGSGEKPAMDFKETVWSHVRSCEHFGSDGKLCGCGRQPGYDKIILGKEYKNLCFAHLEFIEPDMETIKIIEKLLVLYKQNIDK